MGKHFVLVVLFCGLLLSSCADVWAQPAQIDGAGYTIAIVPYLNTTEESRGYINEIMEVKYTEYTDGFAANNFKVVSAEAVQAALNNAGYDASNMELPEKGVFWAVAQETEADYVVAMEINQLLSTRHKSYFTTKVETKARLKYRIYNLSQDKVTAFQTTGHSENVAFIVVGDVGYKVPITEALNKAMDTGYDKIVASL